MGAHNSNPSKNHPNKHFQEKQQNYLYQYSSKLKQMMTLYLQYKHDYQLQTLITPQEFLDLEYQVHSKKQSSPLNNEGPLLDSIQKTIWKLLLILPCAQYLPQVSYIQNYNKSKILLTNEECMVIKKDICRTYAEWDKLDRQSVYRLLVFIYGNVLEPLGYYSGDSFVMAFLFQCGFSLKQAFYLYIALKINRDFQFIRKINKHQQSTQALPYKLGLTFSTNLSHSYPSVYSLFQRFPILPELACISDFFCLCTNWGYAQHKKVALIWDFVIRSSGIHSIVTIQSEIARLWFQTLSQQVKFGNADDETLTNIYCWWCKFHEKISIEEISKIIKRINDDAQNRARQSLKQLDPNFTRVSTNEVSYHHYLNQIYSKAHRPHLQSKNL